MAGTISIEYSNDDENTMLVPKFVLIATGSKPKSIPGLPVDGDKVLYSDQLLQIEQLPTSILIVGGGVIGIEWASMLQDLGVKVTVIENRETILLEEDKDIQNEMMTSLTNRGVQFLTNTSIDPESLYIDETGVSIKANNNGQTIEMEAEKLLVSVGRKANIDGIGLSNTAIEIVSGVIQTNDMYQTKESHIYAIGDCIGGKQLAHVASAEGIVAVEHMAGKNPEPINPVHIPVCIYSYPEVGRVGLTEEMAKQRGYTVKIGSFSFQGIGKAHVFGDTNGFVKIIVDEKTEDLLGIHMIGPNVTDMISEAGLAKVLDATAWEISKTIHPHPSLSEVFFETALSVDQLQIHG